MSAMLNLDESALVEHVRGQRWFGAKSRELVGATVLDVAALREIDPPLYLVLAELRYPEGTHDLYQLVLGPDERIHDALEDDSPAREILHMIRSGAKVSGSEGTVEFQAVPGFAGRRARADRGSPDRGRAVEHVGRLRRRADPQDLPPPRGGAEPRARAGALPLGARVPAHPRARGLVRVRGAAPRGDARDPAGVRARCDRRLGARAARAGAVAGRLPRALAAARRGHRRHAHDAGVGADGSRVRARGAEHRVARAADGDDRRRHREPLRGAAGRQRGAGADRRVAARTSASVCAG